MKRFICFCITSMLALSTITAHGQAVDSTGLDKLSGVSTRVENIIPKPIPGAPAVNWQMTALSCDTVAVIGPPNTSFELISQVAITGNTDQYSIITNEKTDGKGFFYKSERRGGWTPNRFSYWIRKDGKITAALTTHYIFNCVGESS